MLSVIWTIIKILLIIIAIVLAIAVIVLLLILYAPIVYNGSSGYKNRPFSENKCRWMFGLIGFKAGYDTKPYANGHIFWKKIDFLEEDSSDLDSQDTFEDAGEINDTNESPFTQNDLSDIDKNDTYKTEKKQKKHKKESELGGKTKAKASIKDRVIAFKDSLLEKSKSIKSKKDKILDFINDENNKRLWKLLKKRAYYLLRHIRPRKVSGYLTYGFEDPYYTGKLLSYLAIMPISYKKDVTITPEFNNQIIDTKAYYRGHIQLGVIIYHLLIVWFDKDFKRVYNLYKNR